MGKRRDAAIARLNRLRERRRERAKLKTAFVVEHQGVFRELIEMVRRTMSRRRSEAS
jgi:hypothetical protein